MSVPAAKHAAPKRFNANKFTSDWANQTLAGLIKLPTAHLHRVAKRLESLTNTNCGWVIYTLAPGLRELVANVRSDRRKYGRRALGEDSK